MSIIYYAANKVTGKLYVGQCQRSLAWKKSIYKSMAKTRNEDIFSAIREYGFDNFHWGVLAEGEFTQDELDQLENEWMEKLNSLAPHGYNKRTGGRHGKYSQPLLQSRQIERAARYGKAYGIDDCNLYLECVR